MKARVLYVIADVIPFGSGEQATLIAPHLRESFEIDIFCCARRDPKYAGNDVADHWFEYEWGKRNWPGAARSLGKCLRNRYDLIHTWDQRSSALTQWTLLAAGRAARRSAWIRQAGCSLPNAFSWMADAKLGFPQPAWILGDHRLLHSAAGLENATAVPWAATPATSESMVARSDLPVGMPMNLIGTVCPLEVRSGLKHLIWSLDQLKCIRDDLRLVVWGAGSQAASLRTYARQIGIRDWIQWRSPHFDVRAELAGVDMYWHAPQSDETPGALISALSRGLPAIAPNTAASAELAQAWSTSLFTVPWGARDEIARRTQLWLQGGWKPKAEPSAAKWLQDHAPRVVAQEYAMAYQRVLGR